MEIDYTHTYFDIKKDLPLYYDHRHWYDSSDSKLWFLKSWGIHIIWDWYDWDEEAKWFDEIVSYYISKEDTNKLIEILKKEYPDYKSKIDLNRCKDKVWKEEWDKLSQREKEIYSIIEAIFSVFDAYAAIFHYIQKKHIPYHWYGADFW